MEFDVLDDYIKENCVSSEGVDSKEYVEKFKNHENSLEEAAKIGKALGKFTKKEAEDFCRTVAKYQHDEMVRNRVKPRKKGIRFS